MTLADQAAISGHDGRVGSGKPGRPKRRTFTMAYEARIVAAFDELPEGSPGCGELLRREGLYHSHIEDWRRQLGNATRHGSLSPTSSRRSRAELDTTAPRSLIHIGDLAGSAGASLNRKVRESNPSVQARLLLVADPGLRRVDGSRSVTEAYDWSWLRNRMPVVDLSAYVSMPEDVARLIEVRDGMILHCESPSPNHVAVCDNFKSALRDAVAKRSAEEPCLRASGELDMLVSEVPFHFKRPDGIVYRCVEEPRGKWKTKPTAADALLVIEVVSPGTVTADLVDKRALYARLGIPQYWIVRMTNDDGPVRSIETLRLTADGTYVTERVAARAQGEALAVKASDPLEVSIGWDQLDLGLD